MGVSNHARLVNFERAIRRWIPGGLGDAIAEYAVWNYFTGANHRPGEYYVEGSKYGQVRARTLQTPSRSPSQTVGRWTTPGARMCA